MTTARESRKKKTKVFVVPRTVSIRGENVPATVPKRPGRFSMNLIEIKPGELTRADERAGLRVGDIRRPAEALDPEGEFLPHTSWVAQQIARGTFVETAPPSRPGSSRPPAVEGRHA